MTIIKQIGRLSREVKALLTAHFWRKSCSGGAKNVVYKSAPGYPGVEGLVHACGHVITKWTQIRVKFIHSFNSVFGSGANSQWCKSGRELWQFPAWQCLTLEVFILLEKVKTVYMQIRCSFPALYNLSIWVLISQRLSNFCSRIIIGLDPTNPYL